MVSLVMKFDEDLDMADPSTKTAYLCSLFIRNQFQGKGYAKSAINLAEDFARKRGIKRITLHTSVASKKLIPLYVRLGYTEFKARNLDWGEAGEAHMMKVLSEE
ncbi:hypothetical protein HK100_010554, partial [Physocladia obscura]